MCCTQWLSAARAATELDAAHEEKQLRACGTAKDPKATVVEHEMILLRYAQFRIIHPSFRVARFTARFGSAVCCSSTSLSSTRIARCGAFFHSTRYATLHRGHACAVFRLWLGCCGRPGRRVRFPAQRRTWRRFTGARRARYRAGWRRMFRCSTRLRRCALS